MESFGNANGCKAEPLPLMAEDTGKVHVLGSEFQGILCARQRAEPNQNSQTYSGVTKKQTLYTHASRYIFLGGAHRYTCEMQEVYKHHRCDARPSRSVSTMYSTREPW